MVRAASVVSARAVAARVAVVMALLRGAHVAGRVRPNVTAPGFTVKKLRRKAHSAGRSLRPADTADRLWRARAALPAGLRAGRTASPRRQSNSTPEPAVPRHYPPAKHQPDSAPSRRSARRLAGIRVTVGNKRWSAL